MSSGKNNEKQQKRCRFLILLTYICAAWLPGQEKLDIVGAIIVLTTYGNSGEGKPPVENKGKQGRHNVVYITI